MVEIVCDNCAKKYVIDESRLPEKGNVAIKCPNCSNKITVNRKAGIQEALDSSGNGTLLTSSVHVHDTDAAAKDADAASSKDAMEYFPEGTKTALVFCKDHDAEREIERHIEQAGYEKRCVNSANEMAERFRYHQYDLVVLHQSGPEPSEELVHITNYLTGLPGSVRRKTVIIRIMLGGSQYDEMQAFMHSTDAVISPTELGSLAEIVKRIVSRKEMTYRVFFDCLEKAAEKRG